MICKKSIVYSAKQLISTVSHKKKYLKRIKIIYNVTVVIVCM